MAKPFISHAPERKKRAEWLAEILKALGFEEAILTSGADPKGSRKKIKEDLERADCCLALVSPLRGPDSQTVDWSRPAPWIEQDITGAAIHREIPVALIWEKNMHRSAMYEEMAFASEEANFDDPEALLALTPKFVAIARKLRDFFEKTAGEDFPFISEQVHIINQFSEKEWCQLRTISLTAVKKAEFIDHGVTVGQTTAGPGISVKLADPERDLKVTCITDPGRIETVLTKNEEHDVEYRVMFTPPLKPPDTIVYKHKSRHQNIFPMTLKAVRERAKQTGSPVFMKDGFVGDDLKITRPIETLILEVEAALALGLGSPEVKVYVANTMIEIEDESTRIGNPVSKPRIWNVTEDINRELWNCRVTIAKPKIGYAYYLLVKPKN